MRYAYWTGIKSREAAEDALEHALCAGDVSLAERPEIESYRVTAPNGGYRIRYKITQQH